MTKLKDLPIPPSAKLVPFDVSSLFSNIPVGEAMEIMINWLDKSKTNPVKGEEKKLATETCLKQNYFLFQQTLYTQSDGLAMGSPPLAPYKPRLSWTTLNRHF